MLHTAIKALLIVLLLPAIALGQSITGVTGVLDNGETVTISGTSFGAKNAGPPLVWDDLSYYSGYSDYEECQLGGDNPWISKALSQAPYYFANSDSVRVVGRPLYGATRAGAFWGGDDYTLTDNETITFNYWLWFNKYPPILAAGHVSKLIRFWSWDAVPYTGLNLFFDSTQNAAIYRYYDDDFVAKETWLHFEVVVRNSTGMTTDLETTTGTYDVYMNGQKMHDTQPLGGDLANGGDVSHIHRFGFDVRGEGYFDDWDTGTIMRFGDAYIDRGTSKVLITDVSDFSWDNASPVHWEVQPVTSWTATSINFTVNGGSFEGGSAVYVYVIDENENISNASAVILGEDGGGDIPFTAPSGLTVTGGN